MKRLPEEKHIRIYVTYDERTYGGEAHDPDDRWTSYEPSEKHVKFTGLSLSQPNTVSFKTVEVTDDRVLGLKEAYLSVIRYSTGDTFGSTSGEFELIGVSATEEEAEAMVQDAVKNGLPGQGGYKPWQGYFERFERTEVHRLPVR